MIVEIGNGSLRGKSCCGPLTGSVWERPKLGKVYDRDRDYLT